MPDFKYNPDNSVYKKIKNISFLKIGNKYEL